MLTSAHDFAELQGSRRTRADTYVAVRFRRTDLPETRFGFATGRKLGGAVVRNRVRRRLRSILRGMEPRLIGGWDVLISVRPAGATVSQATLGASVGSALQAAGVLKGDVTNR
jgi:ribonuclease P protein component